MNVTSDPVPVPRKDPASNKPEPRSLPEKLSDLSLLIALIFGLLVIVCYAWSLEHGHRFSTMSMGFLLGGTASLVGGLIGFLFGIPLSVQTENSSGYRPNTSLEQVSDWLTKIIVGVGLTQLTPICRRYESLVEYIVSGVPDLPVTQPFVSSLLLYFGIGGFFFGFIYARIALTKMFASADQEMSEKMKVIEGIKIQTDQDAEALRLASRQLDTGGAFPVDPKELHDAIVVASPDTKARIFYQACRVRQENWKDNKERMARSIPIFRTLAEIDTQKDYHTNHGQLGFALKDREKPDDRERTSNWEKSDDWKEAMKELTTAIQIRDEKKQSHFFSYEFNRAVCRIRLAKARKEALNESEKKEILADLQKAARNDQNWKRIILSDEETEIREWLKGNGYSNDQILDTP